MSNPFAVARKFLPAEELPAVKEPLDDPILAPGDWYPEFHRVHIAAIHETSDLDYGWVRCNQPDLYRRIKTIEDRIDGLQDARLSLIIGMMREWRDLVLNAEFEQRKAQRQLA